MPVSITSKDNQTTIRVFQEDATTLALAISRGGFVGNPRIFRAPGSQEVTIVVQNEDQFTPTRIQHTLDRCGIEAEIVYVS